jgi:hypothetical protein
MPAGDRTGSFADGVRRAVNGSDRGRRAAGPGPVGRTEPLWRWWNGACGRLARRDVVVLTDDTGARWAVEIREGGTDGRSRWREVATE